MRHSKRWSAVLSLSVLSLLAQGPSAQAEVTIADHQGQKLEFVGLHFRDESGKPVELGSYFNPNRPVLLTLVYYGCQGICTVTLNGLFESLKQARYTPGKAIEVVAVSIDPQETPESARKKKLAYLSHYGFEKDAEGFHFLVGEQPAITRLANNLGFKYESAGRQFAHPGVVYVLSPEGVITKSLPGSHFRARDFRQLIASAASGRTISSFERMVLACPHWWEQGWAARILSFFGF